MAKKPHPLGELIVTAKGKEYRLHFGMSTIADLQAKHGDKIDAILAGAETGKMPDFGIMLDIFIGALQRHHADVADRYLVDDLVAENQNLLPRLMQAAWPDAPEGEASSEGNGAAAA